MTPAELVEALMHASNFTESEIFDAYWERHYTDCQALRNLEDVHRMIGNVIQRIEQTRSAL